MKKIRKLIKKVQDYLNERKKIKFVLFICAILVNMLMQFGLMQLSTLPHDWLYINSSVKLVLINTFLVFTLNSVFYIFLRKWKHTLLFSTILISIWSFANYYTILYHGGPLFISEFANFQTAINVMDHSQVTFTEITNYLIIGIVLLFIYHIIFRLIFTEKEVNLIIWKRIILACTTLFISFNLLFSEHAFKPRSSMNWSWIDATSRYGVTSMLVEDVDMMVNYLKTPNNYSEENVKSIKTYQNKVKNKDKQNPDIILILNESFYDMNYYDEFKTDLDPMESYYNIDGARYGHTIVPGLSGGTNDTEYELLTSNSMYLLNSRAPFNYINLKRSNSNVRYLEDLGYTTAGMHPDVKYNYRRYAAYPTLGFDQSLLDIEYFRYTFYGNRRYLDKDNYEDMLKYYNEMGDGSRFVYLLTVQNHWGWEKNDDSYDTVHVLDDYGQYTDDLNEYFTSVKMTGEAFKDLTDYYRNQDRPVIIAMLGDHCPNILNFLTNTSLEANEDTVKKKTTPFVVWSNFELDDSVNIENIPVSAVVPTVLKMAGLPMSTYHKELYDITQTYGAITSDGLLVDKNNNINSIQDGDNWDKVKKYYYMEYNDLHNEKNRRKDLFTVAFNK